MLWKRLKGFFKINRLWIFRKKGDFLESEIRISRNATVDWRLATADCKLNQANR
jgi:hypothetical protein